MKTKCSNGMDCRRVSILIAWASLGGWSISVYAVSSVVRHHERIVSTKDDTGTAATMTQDNINMDAALKTITAKMGKAEYGSCGDCYCIPDPPGSSCPVSSMPQTDYGSLIPILKAFTLVNPYSLSCNPYDDASCSTVPPLETGGACIVDLIPPTSQSGRPLPISSCPLTWTYRTRTYAGTFEQAQAEGLLVTHAEACGVCSSFQDLAVFMKSGPKLTNQSTFCGIVGLRDTNAGIQCFVALGFTPACAAMWLYDSKATSKDCLAVCTKFTFSHEPNNGPPPNCTLADCLECDETNAGPIFQLYTGRSRRNSGMLSDIARPCNAIANIQQSNPCDA